MAENDLPVSIEPQVHYDQETLKYLDVVQKAAQNAVPYVSKAYDYAKDNSGSVKPGVETIEGTLKTVVGPAVDKFRDVPVEVLKLADRKVDECVTKAMSTSVATDIKNHGVVKTASGITKSTYTKVELTAKEVLGKYEPVAEQHAASAWQSLNKMPLFRSVARRLYQPQLTSPEKYNQTVQQTAEEGYQVSSYLPLVPTEKIGKVFKAPDPEAELAETEPEAVVHSGDEDAVVAR